jgi:hypothetical protein
MGISKTQICLTLIFVIPFSNNFDFKLDIEELKLRPNLILWEANIVPIFTSPTKKGINLRKYKHQESH